MTGTDGTGSDGRVTSEDPAQAPLTLELLADLHAVVFDERVSTQLYRRADADPRQSFARCAEPRHPGRRSSHRPSVRVATHPSTVRPVRTHETTRRRNPMSRRLVTRRVLAAATR